MAQQQCRRSLWCKFRLCLYYIMYMQFQTKAMDDIRNLSLSAKNFDFRQSYTSVLCRTDHLSYSNGLTSDSFDEYIIAEEQQGPVTQARGSDNDTKVRHCLLSLIVLALLQDVTDFLTTLLTTVLLDRFFKTVYFSIIQLY